MFLNKNPVKPSLRSGHGASKKIRQHVLVLLVVFLVGGFLFVGNYFQPKELRAASVLELNDQIRAKNREINNLQKQVGVYKKNIADKEKEAVSLVNQLAILDNRIAKIELDIKIKEAEISQVNLEIKVVEETIKETQKKIDQHKNRLAEFIRTIHRQDQKSYLEVLLLNDSFSEFFNQLKYLEEVQSDLQEVLNEVQELKQQLELQRRELGDRKDNLEKLKKELEQERLKLSDQKEAKQTILVQTRALEQKFQNLLVQARREQQQADIEIKNLEKTIREKLTGRREEGGESRGVQVLWSVDPSRGITAYFHDPDYPFRYIFEHPAIDIRASQGTSIKAAESGYVARAKDAGMGYSYIMIVHEQGFSTVYGHVSRIDVKEDDYVVQGQQIGLSGGMPGTRGAGSLTTGPHLHFEVRLNGIPVNPLEYLP